MSESLKEKHKTHNNRKQTNKKKRKKEGSKKLKGEKYFLIWHVDRLSEPFFGASSTKSSFGATSRSFFDRFVVLANDPFREVEEADKYGKSPEQHNNCFYVNLIHSLGQYLYTTLASTKEALKTIVAFDHFSECSGNSFFSSPTLTISSIRSCIYTNCKEGVISKESFYCRY